MRAHDCLQIFPAFTHVLATETQLSGPPGRDRVVLGAHRQVDKGAALLVGCHHPEQDLARMQAAAVYDRDAVVCR